MANVIYNSFKTNIGTIDWSDNSNTTIKVMLVTSDYAPDIDTHAFASDVTNEVSGDGYTAGGQAIANRTVTKDNTNDVGKYDGDDVTWSSSTIRARGCVVYKDTGDATTSPLIGYIDFTEDKASSAGDFVLQWNSEGIFIIG